LSDQVDPSYQIFNLRMMMKRAVSVRLWEKARADGVMERSPRRQAVVSFNISLDPPVSARDAAAYVEITLSTKRGPISLVASMPQEKTYNATSLSSSSKAFGGSAVAKIISVNYNQRKRSQTFFLYRDSDTLALEWPSGRNSVTFGWVFRPVLGRRSVSPGMRQLFAVISLPDTDLLGDGKKESEAEEEKHMEYTKGKNKDDEETGYLHVHVDAKTYWLHYDKNTSTTVTHPGFWDWSAKGVPVKEDHIPLNCINILPTDSISKPLMPSVRDVDFFKTASGNTVLQIVGQNFFTGTTFTIGDKTFAGPQDGFFLKSSQTILLSVSADTLSHAYRLHGTPR
jgi:hypothetical protein